jgi:hypothetical protein
VIFDASVGEGRRGDRIAKSILPRELIPEAFWVDFMWILYSRLTDYTFIPIMRKNLPSLDDLWVFYLSALV